MESQKFTATLSVRGNSVAVPIPFDPNEVWGTRDRHDVSGTINECRIRGALQPDRDGYVLMLGPSWRRDNGLALDEEVRVELAPEGPQMDNMPADFADALAANPEAKAFFESIAPFYRKNYLRWIEDARRPETRTRRIGEAMTQLAEKKRR